MTKIVAVVGSYRKGGMTDSAVEAVLEGARAKGAEVSKIYLLDKRIEFCTNCRACTQTEGAERGRCIHEDDLESILSELDAADAIVLAAPVNFYNVNALFRRFMERLVAYAYWPWGQAGPKYRKTECTKKAALVTSAAMPGLMIGSATGALRALKLTAKVLGAKPVGILTVGLSAQQPKQELRPSVLTRARKIGESLA